VTVYPVAIALVALSLLSGCWKHARRVYAPVMAVALLLGLLDGAKAVGLMELPEWITNLPGAAMGMAWLTPVLAMLLLAATADRLLPARSHPAQA
jgi:LIVCS family branched-chain amino acid:cation transporter